MATQSSRAETLSLSQSDPRLSKDGNHFEITFSRSAGRTFSCKYSAARRQRGTGSRSQYRVSGWRPGWNDGRGHDRGRQSRRSFDTSLQSVRHRVQQSRRQAEHVHSGDSERRAGRSVRSLRGHQVRSQLAASVRRRQPPGDSRIATGQGRGRFAVGAARRDDQRADSEGRRRSVLVLSPERPASHRRVPGRAD